MEIDQTCYSEYII